MHVKEYGPWRRILAEFSEKRLEKEMTGHFTFKKMGNRKHQPKAREWQTEAHV